MGLFRSSRPAFTYDPKTQEPAVKRSICTGEMTIGYIEKATGRFHEVCRVNGQRELDAICRSLGVTEIKTIY